MAVGDRWARRNVGFVEEFGARPEHGGSTAEVAGQPVGPGGAEDGVRVAYPARVSSYAGSHSPGSRLPSACAVTNQGHRAQSCSIGWPRAALPYSSKPRGLAEPHQPQGTSADAMPIENRMPLPALCCVARREHFAAWSGGVLRPARARRKEQDGVVGR